MFFASSWGDDPIWLIFFNRVETTTLLRFPVILLWETVNKKTCKTVPHAGDLGFQLKLSCFCSKKIPTDPWNIPRPLTTFLWREPFIFGLFGISGVCSTWMSRGPGSERISGWFHHHWSVHFRDPATSVRGTYPRYVQSHEGFSKHKEVVT